jgi:GntR family galactonate operon transcriptional repressor
VTLDDPAKPLLKPRVHRHVVKTLAQRILGNEFRPGMVLPSEPELCETFKVSRSALREAVKVLDSKGMVVTRPRIGTTVRAREDWNLLDPDVLAWSMDLSPSAELVLSLIEARQVIEPAAARFAALRATATDIAPMEGAYARMERYKASQDFEAFNKADIDFHTALLRASRNIVFQQLSNTIGAALAYSFRLTIARAREPGASLPNHGEVIERIRLRDAEGAYASMARLLNIAIVDLGIHQ